MSNLKKKSVEEEEEKRQENSTFDPNKLKQKILSNDSLENFRLAIDEELLEEDEDYEKINQYSPLSESFIMINKENLGEGSSRSTYEYIE